MARLTGEAARRWLAENPNASYIDNRTGQKVQAQQNPFLKILLNITKPLRTVVPAGQELVRTIGDLGRTARGEALSQAPETYFGMTPEESAEFTEDPLQRGVKAGVGLMSYGVPVGAAKGVTGLKAVGQAMGKGAIAGGMGGLAYSEEGKEFADILKGGVTGGLFAGALQGIGEGAKALTKTAGTGKVVNTLDVDEIAKLPSKTRSGLVKQAKSAGFWDGGLSESKNIQNYLTNRGLAGNTPAETLENLTQEFNRAGKLKQEGLKEIGGLSRGYTEQIKNNLDEAIKYKGIGLDSETSKVYNDIIKTLDKGPQGARELDNIVMKWNEAGRLASGAQKTSVAGLYSDAAKAVRDTMRSIPGATKYDQGLKALNQILGVEDTGLISKAAKTAESGGIDLPLFSGAGFRGADIKTPIISNTISKAQAAIGRGQEMGGSGILGGGLSKGIQGLTGIGQRAIPAIPGINQGISEGRQIQQPQQLQPQMSQQGQGISAINLMLAQEVLNRNISATEANAVLSLLGMDQGGATGKMTETQRDYQLAAEAIEQAYGVLEQAGGAGKLATLGGNIAGFFGSTSASSEYRAALDTATAFLRKALIGSGQSEAELKNLNLPKPTDEPEIAKQKITTLIPLLRARAGLQQY